MTLKQINILVDSVKLFLIILFSIAMISVIILFASDDPLNAIYYFFIGPFTSLRRIGNIIEGAIPLIFTALAVIIIFRCGLFSMISEGSFFIGLLGATIIGTTFDFGAIATPFVAIVFAAVLGSIASSIPALLKFKWDVSEVVSSIMLNYIIQFFVIYMISYHYREPLASSLASLKINENSQLALLIKGTKVHFGLIIALLFCTLVWVILYRSRLGFKIRVIGSNSNFAKYVGIKTGVSMVIAQIIAGAIAGAGGGVEMLGMYTRFKWTTSPGYGWTGIAVALLAHSNPIMVPIAALFIAYLDVGAAIMARSSDVSNEIVMVIQGVMMLLIAANALFSRWRQSLVVKNATSENKSLLEAKA
ncbi:MAG: ABC transporter permease [Pleomorphochaeta sp.]